MGSRRSFSHAFKRQVVEEYLSGSASQAQLSRRYSLSPHQIALWRKRYSQGKLNDNNDAVSLAKDARIRELERLVGKQALQIELLKKAEEYYQQELNDNSSIVSGPTPRRARSKRGAR
jgi:transposase-like protein